MLRRPKHSTIEFIAPKEEEVMNEIFTSKPITGSLTDKFWSAIKCSMYLTKFLTSVSLFSNCGQWCKKSPNAASKIFEKSVFL